MLEKCSSAASFSSAVASCSSLRFLDARRAWRKTSTCGEQAWVLEATLARQSRQAKEKQKSKAVVAALLETRGGKRVGVWRGQDPRATRPAQSSDLGLPEGLLHLLQEFQLVFGLLQVAV